VANPVDQFSAFTGQEPHDLLEKARALVAQNEGRRKALEALADELELLRHHLQGTPIERQVAVMVRRAAERARQGLAA
jgi:hypothetical protein